MINEILKRSETFGLKITDEIVSKFEIYEKELINWNSQFNLTAIIKPEEIELRHFVDSLSVVKAIPQNANRIIDIGSGAGFPGVPLEIVRPELKLVLLESVGKKAIFLNSLVEKLGLANVQVISTRAEDLGRDKNYRESFDVAAARGVANLATLSEYALPFVKIGGIFVSQKSKGAAEEEVPKAKKAINELGGKLKDVVSVEIGDLEERSLIVIEKIKDTPGKYPRREGVPLKKPL